MNFFFVIFLLFDLVGRERFFFFFFLRMAWELKPMHLDVSGARFLFQLEFCRFFFVLNVFFCTFRDNNGREIQRLYIGVGYFKTL